MEFIYVVKRGDLFDMEFPHGFFRLGEEELRNRYLDRIETEGFFAERHPMEGDSSFKQIIPYSVITHGNEVFLLRRLFSQAESRLHNKLSIGVGGHVNPIDAKETGRKNCLAAACRREILEEVTIGEDFTPFPVGIVNDDSNPVGSVHFGIVHLVRLEGKNVSVREKEMMEGAFVPLDELKRIADDPEAEVESWSALILEKIEELLNL